MENIDQFAWKMNKMSELIEYLFIKSEENSEKINADDKKYEKLISESFRRLEDKMGTNLDTFNKTMSLFFSQSN